LTISALEPFSRTIVVYITVRPAVSDIVQFLKYAEDCVRAVEEVSDPRCKLLLFETAQRWMELTMQSAEAAKAARGPRKPTKSRRIPGEQPRPRRRQDIRNAAI